MEQNEYLELGYINRLQIDRDTPHGVFCMAKDGNDVLLPQSYVTEEMVVDSFVEIFLYTDSEDRLIGTTMTPVAMLDEFALFEVVDIAPFGAFMNWGLHKDLLVPNMFQKTPFVKGEKRFLKVVYDERTHRLVGTEKLGDFFERRVKGLKVNQKVSMVVIAKTPLGYKTIVEEKYEGLIYANEIFQQITLGDKLDGFIKTIRSDGNIDLSLREKGSSKNSSSVDRIYELLKANGGIMPYNSKSDATQITDVFSMSKKDFKRSLTTLAKSGKIEIKDNGIYIKE